MTTFDQKDEVLFRIHARILTDGVYLDFVPGDGRRPPWAHTIGLLEMQHPEVVVFGLDRVTTQDVIEALFHEVVCGLDRPVGRQRRQSRLGCAPPRSVRMVPVADVHWECAGDHRLCPAAMYHLALGRRREELRALQLVWANRSGRFPWHANASEADRRRQPLLDRVGRSDR
jgi:hypothetical protein